MRHQPPGLLLPFSGYYDPTLEPGQSYSEEVSSSLSVNILPAASAIDLIKKLPRFSGLELNEVMFGTVKLELRFALLMTIGSILGVVAHWQGWL